MIYSSTRTDQKIGCEFKFSETPKSTKSMHSAIADLALHHLYVIHPKEHTFPLTEKITAAPLEKVIKEFTCIIIHLQLKNNHAPPAPQP